MSAGKPIAPRPTGPAGNEPCYGVMCPMHGDCARYRAVESMPAARVVIATCVTSAGRRPGFVLAAEVCT